MHYYSLINNIKAHCINARVILKKVKQFCQKKKKRIISSKLMVNFQLHMKTTVCNGQLDLDARAKM